MHRRIGTFSNNESGAIAILFSFSLTIICVCIGGAIDFARYNSAKSQTSAAIDAAVLAGARVLLLGGTATQAEAAAQQYYARNIADRLEVLSDDVTFSVTDNNTALSGSGNAHLPTTLLKLAGINSLPLVTGTNTQFAKAKISGGGGGDIEVSVMLDVTGSMCDDGTGPCTFITKMDALKTATKDLVNIVVLADQSDHKSRVALVPFQQRIRVAPTGAGGNIMRALTDLPPTWSGWDQMCTATEYAGTSETVIIGGETGGTYGGDHYVCTKWEPVEVNNWKIRPCVTERFFEASDTFDLTDDAPGANAWINGEDGRRNPLSIDSGNNPATSGLGATPDDPRMHHNYNTNGSCNEPEANQLMPLTSDKDALNLRIDGLVGQHATGGAFATAMTWYTLSPNFKNAWPSSAAASYEKLAELKANGKPKLRKVAILMTDGVYNTQRGWPTMNQQASSTDAKAVCAAMKAKGIEIYTVGFDLDSLPSSERSIAVDTLQSCGTSIEHFYNSIDPNELQEAFRDIAVKLSSISLAN